MSIDKTTIPARIKNRKAALGFSLIELLIVIAIIGILAGIAYPSYTATIIKTKRSDGALALMEAVQAMERCKSTTFSYANCGLTAQHTVSPDGNYTLALSPAPTASEFTIVATPAGAQVNDSECTSMSINYLGTQASTPSSTAGTDENGCWN